MAIQKCGECGGEVSDKADKCPKCGAPVKKPGISTGGGCSVIILLFVILFFIVPALLNSTRPPARPSATSVQSSPSTATATQKKLSAEPALSYLNDKSALPEVKWVNIGDGGVNIGFKTVPSDLQSVIGAAAARGASAVEGSYSARAYKGGDGKTDMGKDLCNAIAEYRPSLPGKIKGITTHNGCR